MNKNGLLILKFTQSDLFQSVYKHTEGITPEQALTRDFFLGTCKLDTNNDKIIIVENSAFNGKTIKMRLEDNRYCKKCLQYERHTFECKDSGW